MEIDIDVVEIKRLVVERITKNLEYEVREAAKCAIKELLNAELRDVAAKQIRRAIDEAEIEPDGISFREYVERASKERVFAKRGSHSGSLAALIDRRIEVTALNIYQGEVNERLKNVKEEVLQVLRTYVSKG